MNRAKKQPLILGIESSCDETAAAVIRGRELLSDEIASSAATQAKYGGVVPEIASRAHAEAVDEVVARALQSANVQKEELDAVAVTYGETTAEVALENAITEIDNVRALEIAAETFKEDIDAALASGGFGRETYVKLVRNDHDPEGGYYWFVSFIADRDDYWAALIDSKTGEVISTRKSAASESEETVATDEIPV